MFFDTSSTYNLLCESENTFRYNNSKDENSIVNTFTTKPQGIIIQDTFNNPFFPIPFIQIDTAKMDLLEIYRRYRELYTSFESIMLPWHYVIEMVDSRYNVFQTRPINMKFPLTNQDVINRNYEKGSDTYKFLRNNIFDISEAIHVCILGDTNLDVYTKVVYEMIGRFCINPYLKIFKIVGSLDNGIFSLNIGKRFNLNYVLKFIK